MVALPAVEVLLKNVTPPFPQVVMAASLVMAAPLPAVALLTNCIPPLLPDPSTAVTKFWAIPELFVIPTPLMSKTTPGLAVVVNALAPPLNTIPLTSVNGPPETEMPIMLEDANVAVSADPLGGPPAVQLAAVFQSPVAGFVNQVALAAKLLLAVESRSGRMATAEARKAHARDCKRD
jgi:hypothetical protein